jgi:acetaldehyde dehydrogenase/alcohol dehydrogenase
VDSTFCDKLPKSLVAFAGLDAVTHAVEAYVSVASNEFTEGHSLKALKLLTNHLVDSYLTGNSKAREAVHTGATLAGLAFSNSFLGIGHSLAHKFGAAFHLPHGLTCAVLLPHVIRYNACLHPTRMGIYPGYDYPKALHRYARIAEYLNLKGDTQDELKEAFITKLYEMYTAMNVPKSFNEAGCDEAKFLELLDELALKAFDDQCTPANPRFPLVSELKEILKQAFYGEEYHCVDVDGDAGPTYDSNYYGVVSLESGMFDPSSDEEA